jgi:hypothetical protein
VHLSKSETSVTITRKFRWERGSGEQTPLGKIPIHRGRKRPMTLTAIEGFFIRMDDGDWSANIIMEGRLVLAKPVGHRTLSSQIFRQTVRDVEEYPWLVELIRQEIPAFGWSLDGDDE